MENVNPFLPSAHAPTVHHSRLLRQANLVGRMPPASFFVTSALFHYLGPSLAVLLFVHVGPIGVAWLRIATAAAVFAVWRKPWRIWSRASGSQRWTFLALGSVLAGMNFLFYLAIDRLPLATVGAIEFLGVIVLAAIGTRTWRNALALALAIAGVASLTEVRLAGEVWGFVFAFGNCVGFALYIVLGHRVANGRGRRADGEGGADVVVGGGVGSAATAGSGSLLRGIDGLGLSMLIAAIVATPFAVGSALPAFTNPLWLLWGVGVGIFSSVIPYALDQLAMARLSRATFAVMLAILPAMATVLGMLVLHQVPTIQDLVGISLIISGVAVRQIGDQRQR